MFPFRRRKRVLILDDDNAVRRLVSLILKRAGYLADAVSNGNDAIAAIAKNDYAAILLDLMMPLEGGMTVMRHLREHTPAILGRVIVVTGAPDAVIDPYRADIFGIVRKPFRHEEIVEMVDRLTKTVS